MQQHPAFNAQHAQMLLARSMLNGAGPRGVGPPGGMYRPGPNPALLQSGEHHGALPPGRMRVPPPPHHGALRPQGPRMPSSNMYQGQPPMNGLSGSPSAVPPQGRTMAPVSSRSQDTLQRIPHLAAQAASLPESSLSRVDYASATGKFGWTSIDGVEIPYLLRDDRDDKKYLAVRMVEMKLLSKYPSTYPEELKKRPPLMSHYITEYEAKLLNEINLHHCNGEYGSQPFGTQDLIVKMTDFEEFYGIVKKHFPPSVLAQLPQMQNQSEKSVSGGWIQLNNTVVPFVYRSKTRFVPLSVVRYAAGLLTDIRVEGAALKEEEWNFLDEICNTAGVEFTFSKTAKLVMLEVVQRLCKSKLNITDLPKDDPFSHAQYLQSLDEDKPSSENPASSSPVSVGNTQSMSLATNQIPYPAPASGRGPLNGTSPPSANTPANQQLPQGNNVPFWMNQHLGIYPGSPGAYPGNSMMRGPGRPPLGPGMPPQVPMHHQNQQSSPVGSQQSNRPSSGPSLTSPTNSIPQPKSQSEVNNNFNSNQRRLSHEAMDLTRDLVSPRDKRELGNLPGAPLGRSLSNSSLSGSNNQAPRTSSAGSAGMQRSTPENVSHNMMPQGPQGIIPGMPPGPFPGPVPMGPDGLPLHGNIVPPGHPGWHPMMSNPAEYHKMVQIMQLQAMAQQHQQQQHQLQQQLQILEQQHIQQQQRFKQHEPVPKPPRVGQNIGNRPELPKPSVQHMPPSRSTPNQITSSPSSSSLKSSSPSLNSSTPKLPNPIQASVNKSSLNQAVIQRVEFQGKTLSCIVKGELKEHYALVEALSRVYFPNCTLDEFQFALEKVLQVPLVQLTQEEERSFISFYNIPTKTLMCNKVIRLAEFQEHIPKLRFMFSEKFLGGPEKIDPGTLRNKILMFGKGEGEMSSQSSRSTPPQVNTESLGKKVSAALKAMGKRPASTDTDSNDGEASPGPAKQARTSLEEAVNRLKQFQAEQKSRRKSTRPERMVGPQSPTSDTPTEYTARSPEDAYHYVPIQEQVSDKLGKKSEKPMEGGEEKETTENNLREAQADINNSSEAIISAFRELDALQKSAEESLPQDKNQETSVFEPEEDVNNLKPTEISSIPDKSIEENKESSNFSEPQSSVGALENLSTSLEDAQSESVAPSAQEAFTADGGHLEGLDIATGSETSATPKINTVAETESNCLRSEIASSQSPDSANHENIEASSQMQSVVQRSASEDDIEQHEESSEEIASEINPATVGGCIDTPEHGIDDNEKWINTQPETAQDDLLSAQRQSQDSDNAIEMTEDNTEDIAEPLPKHMDVEHDEMGEEVSDGDPALVKEHGLATNDDGEATEIVRPSEESATEITPVNVSQSVDLVTEEHGSLDSKCEITISDQSNTREDISQDQKENQDIATQNVTVEPEIASDNTYEGHAFSDNVLPAKEDMQENTLTEVDSDIQHLSDMHSAPIVPDATQSENKTTVGIGSTETTEEIFQDERDLFASGYKNVSLPPEVCSSDSYVHNDGKQETLFDQDISGETAAAPMDVDCPDLSTDQTSSMEISQKPTSESSGINHTVGLKLAVQTEEEKDQEPPQSLIQAAVVTQEGIEKEPSILETQKLEENLGKECKVGVSECKPQTITHPMKLNISQPNQNTDVNEILSEENDKKIEDSSAVGSDTTEAPHMIADNAEDEIEQNAVETSVDNQKHEEIKELTKSHHLVQPEAIDREPQICGITLNTSFPDPSINSSSFTSTESIVVTESTNSQVEAMEISNTASGTIESVEPSLEENEASTLFGEINTGNQEAEQALLDTTQVASENINPDDLSEKKAAETNKISEPATHTSVLGLFPGLISEGEDSDSPISTSEDTNNMETRGESIQAKDSQEAQDVLSEKRDTDYQEAEMNQTSTHDSSSINCAETSSLVQNISVSAKKIIDEQSTCDLGDKDLISTDVNEQVAEMKDGSSVAYIANPPEISKLSDIVEEERNINLTVEETQVKEADLTPTFETVSDKPQDFAENTGDENPEGTNAVATPLITSSSESCETSITDNSNIQHELPSAKNESRSEDICNL